jgi:hypothetical protein
VILTTTEAIKNQQNQSLIGLVRPGSIGVAFGKSPASCAKVAAA